MNARDFADAQREQGLPVWAMLFEYDDPEWQAEAWAEIGDHRVRCHAASLPIALDGLAATIRRERPDLLVYLTLSNEVIVPTSMVDIVVDGLQWTDNAGDHLWDGAGLPPIFEMIP